MRMNQKKDVSGMNVGPFGLLGCRSFSVALGISISAGVQVVLVFSCCLGAQVNQSYVSFRFLGRADVRVHVHVNAAVKVQIIVQLSMRM